MLAFLLFDKGDIDVVVAKFAQAESLHPERVVFVENRKVIVDRAYQIVVHGFLDIIGEESLAAGASIAPYLSLILVELDRSGVEARQGSFVPIIGSI